MGNLRTGSPISRDWTSGETHRRVRRLLLAAGAFCCGLAILAIAAALLSANTADVSHMRIDFHALVRKAEDGSLRTDTTKNRFALFDASGKVIVSTIPAYPAGDSVDLHVLSGLDGLKKDGGSFTFVSPVMRGGAFSGLLLVTAPQSAYRAFEPVRIVLPLSAVFLALSALLLLFLVLRHIRRDLLLPLGLLHDATRSMLGGDLSARLTYDDSGEVGKLCHDFEAMRDELSAAFKRESDLLNGDRVLLACVSHDLKTPLAAISGYAEEIRDGIAESPERIKELSTLMLKRVRLLTKLIDDILEETKAQLGELGIVPQELYAPEFFAEVCGELSLDAARDGIRFEMGEIPNVLITIDRKRITQVLQNLISNSVKYTPDGGRISVRFSVEGDELIVGVRDTGCGIAAGDLPYVFDRFYRGDAARAQNIPGSGLGLSIAKNIVERHGGRIECDSVLGTGTLVSFSLPL